MVVAIYPALLTTIVCLRLWPSSGCKPLLNFWDLLIKDESREPVTVALEIYSVWFFFYSFMYLLTYDEPQRSLFRPFKFHKNYPDHSLVVKEFLRSVKGVGVAAIYSIIVNKLYFHNVLPSIYVPKLLILSELKELRVAHFFAGLAVFAWADFHFYWTHRLFHTKWLYKTFHKCHHESYNPDLFSAMSFHWFESCIYFSSALLVSWILPLWTFRLLIIGLIIFPLEDHLGHGTWSLESSHNHYIHHSKFNWNYGSSPLWDHLMGTIRENNGSMSDREKEAIQQAKLANCKLE